MTRKIYPLLLLILIGFTTQAQKKMVCSNCAVNPYNYKIVKQKMFANASVSSAHALASMVGAEIMKQGGNAFDAAIATQFALAVVYPNAGNIGGGGFMVATTKQGKTLALDYRETAAAKATADMYVQNGVANTNLSQQGHLAAGIPGTVAGLFETHKYAKLPMATLIQPAIDLAEFGFVITFREANTLNNHREAFIKNNKHTPVFVKKDLWKPGDTLVQKDLAQTLKIIKERGKDGFYNGGVAEKIIEEMSRGGGIITLKDLQNYKAVWRKNLSFNYKGYTIIGMPPPSSGGVIITQLMQMIAKKNIKALGFHSPQAVQLMIEAERRAYADRAEHLGDPDFYPVPLDTLISSHYAKARIANFDTNRATKSSQIAAGEIKKQSEETTHLSVVDKEGNLVSVTTTLNDYYGCKTVVQGAGFILNNEMDDFSIKPGTPNMYGAVGGIANAIAPNKRMLSSMTPTIVLKNNKPFLVVGTPGGTTIPTSVFQTLVNILEFNMSVADAINKPKFHHQWLPDVVYVEKTFDKAVMAKLEDKGYKFQVRTDIGRVEAIKILQTGFKETAADFRGDDSVAGF